MPEHFLGCALLHPQRRIHLRHPSRVRAKLDYIAFELVKPLVVAAETKVERVRAQLPAAIRAVFIRTQASKQ